MKINLGELNQLLFPERYPFFREHFREERAILSGQGGADQNILNSIAFKVKVSKLSMKIKQPEIRESIQYIYEDFIGRFYGWNEDYDWRDLKLVLLFFVLFWDVKSIAELESRIRNPFSVELLKNYQPPAMKTK
jgi:hypothetical protein